MSSDAKKFHTSEGLSVFVYKASILKIPVDCIVNATNEGLIHSGGVAHAIASAAGPALDAECRDYIKRSGQLPVGGSCATTAGNLPYRAVIHTVGPRWADYRTHYQQEVDRCVADLWKAIIGCCVEAQKLHMTSVGIPSVSAGTCKK
jgi:O-acetyl-ADP-ribose deacetylase (regulator of RNase III)